MSLHYMQHNEQGRRRRRLHTTTLVEAYQQLQLFAQATMLYNPATTPKAIIMIMAGRVLEPKGRKNQGKLSLSTCQPTNLLTKLLGRWGMFLLDYTLDQPPCLPAGKNQILHPLSPHVKPTPFHFIYSSIHPQSPNYPRQSDGQKKQWRRGGGGGCMASPFIAWTTSEEGRSPWSKGCISCMC